MNFTKEDYKNLRVHFSIKLDPSNLDLPESLFVNSDSTTCRSQLPPSADDLVVGVVGNCPELGRWNPHKSLLLTCMNAMQPNVWQGSTVIRTQTNTPMTPLSPMTPESPPSASFASMQHQQFSSTPSPSPSPSSMMMNPPPTTSSMPPHTIEYKYIILRRVPNYEQEQLSDEESQLSDDDDEATRSAKELKREQQSAQDDVEAKVDQANLKSAPSTSWRIQIQPIATTDKAEDGDTEANRAIPLLTTTTATTSATSVDSSNKICGRRSSSSANTNTSSQTLELLRWETIVGNRKIQAPPDALSVDVFDGEFGEIDNTKEHRKLLVDEGWLSDPNKIELRINLGTYQKYGSTPLKLYHPPYHNQDKFNNGSNTSSSSPPSSFNIQMLLINYPRVKGKKSSNYNNRCIGRRFRTQLSRWMYESETDKVGKPIVLHDEQIEEWRDGDIQIFSTYTSNLANKAVEINILASNTAKQQQQQPTTGGADGGEQIQQQQQQQQQQTVIGKALIIPQMVLPPMFNKEHSNLNNNRNGGHLNLPIIGCPGGDHSSDLSQLTVIGELNCNYLIGRPFEHPENNLSTLWRTHWLTNGRTLNIGHRGMGRSYRQVAPYPKAALTENTILSLVGAAQNGADFVEFDVHLTKDFIPVVYHDLTFSVDLKRAWSQDKHKGHRSYKEHMEVSVHDLTLDQLRRVKTNPIPKHKHIFDTLSPQLIEYWANLLQEKKHQKHEKQQQQQQHQKQQQHGSATTVGKMDKPVLQSEDMRGSRTSSPIQKEVYRFQSLIEQVPTLEEAFRAVPSHVGFNIELKYPETTTQKITFFDMNFFVDTILKVIFDHAGSRRIILSCFDPDICTLCRLKQPRYPVFFLTNGGHIDILEDVRCNSIEQALMFAKTERLLGIIPCSAPLLQNLSLIDKIKKENIVLFTWGDENNDERNIALQRERGVDAVIFDNIGGKSGVVTESQGVTDVK